MGGGRYPLNKLQKLMRFLQNPHSHVAFAHNTFMKL